MSYLSVVKESKVKGLPEDFFGLSDFYTGGWKANQQLEWVYNNYVSQREREAIRAATGCDQAEVIFKKELLYSLSRFFQSLVWGEKYLDYLGMQGKVKFIPTNFYFSLYKILSQKKGVLPESLVFPRSFLLKAWFKERARKFLLDLAILAYPLIGFLLTGRKREASPEKKEFLNGVFIWDSWISSSQPPYRMDFLGESGINPDNTLYVIDRPLNRENRKKIKACAYSYCYLPELIAGFGKKEYLRSVFPRIKRASRLIRLSGLKQVLTSFAGLKALHWLLSREIFDRQYRLRRLVSVQDPGSAGRILLNKNRQSIFVYLSSSPDHFLRPEFNQPFETYYALLCFDTMISSRISIDYFRKNNNLIKNYLECGIIPVDRIHKLKNDQKSNYNLKSRLNIVTGKKVIGFFDSSIGGLGALDCAEGAALYAAVNTLLESRSESCLLLGSRNDNLERKIGKQFSALVSNSRTIYLNRMPGGYQACDFIGVCDLVISSYYSSVPFEALAAGIPAICYCPSSRFQDHRLTGNQLAGFCLKDPEELRQQADFFLETDSVLQAAATREQLIRSQVDSYCDGQATSRLRGYLEKLQ